jgi:hypothetical protein
MDCLILSRLPWKSSAHWFRLHVATVISRRPIIATGGVQRAAQGARDRQQVNVEQRRHSGAQTAENGNFPIRSSAGCPVPCINHRDHLCDCDCPIRAACPPPATIDQHITARAAHNAQRAR